MKGLIAIVVSMIFLVSVSGCVRSYVFEKERVDQQITGNRGILIGEVPPASEPETPPKRTVIGIDVEIPAFTTIGEKPARKKREPTLDKELWGNKGVISSRKSLERPTYPYEGEGIEEVFIVEEPTIFVPPKATKEEHFIEYKVQKGDTLSSIAARSDIYGDAGQWKRIFDANKDIVKNPSYLYPGQILQIPVGGEEVHRGGEIK